VQLEDAPLRERQMGASVQAELQAVHELIGRTHVRVVGRNVTVFCSTATAVR
jgi:hypothetical protein